MGKIEEKPISKMVENMIRKFNILQITCTYIYIYTHTFTVHVFYTHI